MSINLSQLNPEQLKKYIRSLSPGEILFEQGDAGNTMFIIVSGSLTLLEKRADAQYVVGTLSVGQVLGEKAMLTEGTYNRTYTARAETSLTLLEFDNKNLKIVEHIIPNFTSRILGIAAKRLDRANRLITLLRTMDPIERVVNAIIFLAEEHGRPTTEGTEVRLDTEEIFQICHVNRDTIKDCMTILTKAKVIHLKNDLIFIRDLNALVQYCPELKDRVAA